MRSSTGKALSAAGLGLALAVAVAGCSGGDSRAGTVPSRTASPTSTSASPTPTTPEEQVEAAVRNFYAQLTLAVAEGDASRLESLTTRGCPCHAYVETINRLKRRGIQTRGAKWTVLSVNVQNATDKSASADVRYEVSPYVVLNRRGEIVDRYKRQRKHYDLSLVRYQDRWVIGSSFDLEG